MDEDVKNNKKNLADDISYDTGSDTTASDPTLDSTGADDSVVAEESAAETVKKLRGQLKAALEEKQTYLTGWQRDKADFVNARKRDAEAQKEMIKFSNEALIAELIPVLDSFNMAFANKDAWEKVDKNWRTGVEYIASQLKRALEDNGLKEIDPTGQKFDPLRDEATDFEPVSDAKLDGMVTTVIAKGYSYNGRVLKAPKVKVGEVKK
jgi:molecular chaperone GrpE